MPFKKIYLAVHLERHNSHKIGQVDGLTYAGWKVIHSYPLKKACEIVMIPHAYTSFYACIVRAIFSVRRVVTFGKTILITGVKTAPDKPPAFTSIVPVIAVLPTVSSALNSPPPEKLSEIPLMSNLIFDGSLNSTILISISTVFDMPLKLPSKVQIDVLSSISLCSLYAGTNVAHFSILLTKSHTLSELTGICTECDACAMNSTTFSYVSLNVNTFTNLVLHKSNFLEIVILDCCGAFSHNGQHYDLDNKLLGVFVVHC